MIREKSKIFVAGHNGLVGSAIIRNLKLNDYKNIIVADKKISNSLLEGNIF